MPHTKAKIVGEYLNAGWVDLEKMWITIERDHPHLHISWSYLCRIARNHRLGQPGASGADRQAKGT